MQTNVLKVSDNFRKMAVRSVLSIALFLATYLVMVVLGLGVIALCGLIAYGLIMLKAMLITIMLGVGFVGMGFLIFFFLIKFLFSSPQKVDRSHLLIITEKQQPQLFALIREIVLEVHTQFPKNVYLSSDVNASVFYDSNFWSMFFPVRKNLQIGLGLLNSISAIELKAILAHEFGHFSQRSMKVGSYVYNVNKVIYNMLYDNDGYSSALSSWSSASSYFVIFSKGAIWVVGGIQYVLMKVYRVLNLNYMALSREMEFHADAVAASVAGSAPLVKSLLRLGLADQSLSNVFEYYNGKIEESQKTNNFYPQQYFVLQQLAIKEELPVENGLPNLSMDIFKKYKRTKLVLNDQWSSHPSTEERVNKLLELNLPVKGSYDGIAVDLLANKTHVQELVTARLFEAVKYDVKPVVVGVEDFMDDYLQKEKSGAYPAVFKGFFAERNPYIGFTNDDFEPPGELLVDSFDALFGEESAAEINALKIAEADKATIEQIAEGNLDISTFDYDGVKYSYEDAKSLVPMLEEEIVKINKVLEDRDVKIFKFFLKNAVCSGRLDDFKDKSLSYQDTFLKGTKKQEILTNMLSTTHFMRYSTPISEIPKRIAEVKKMELPFKEEVRLMINDPLYSEIIDAETRAGFEEYLSADWKYFANNLYFDQEVDVLFTAMTIFSTVLRKTHFNNKKHLLEFNEELLAAEVQFSEGIMRQA